MTITHTKVSAIADGGDTNLVRPSDWNAGHTLAYRGALVAITANQSIPNNALTVVAWDSEIYDTNNIHESVTNPSRLTVPAGVTAVKIYGGTFWAINSVGVRYIYVYKNGVAAAGLPVDQKVAINETGSNVCSAVVTVNAGDYFTMIVYQDSGGALNMQNSVSTFFGMEIVQ